MKKIIAPLFITLTFCFFASCEKDDICVDGDTPLLVIGFFDVNDTTELKDVPNLRIRGLNQTNPISSENTFTDRSDLDSIGIPLQINATSTGFVFINDSADDDDDMETGTIDTLMFNYEVREQFVSRACGFVANYTALDTVRNVFTTDWIKRITIANPNVENSGAIHVKIFH